MQQFLKAAARATWTEIVATKLFKQFLVAMNHSVASTHVRL